MGRPSVYVASECSHLLHFGFVGNYTKPLDLPPETDAAVQPFLQVRCQLVFAQMTGPIVIQLERHLKRNLVVSHLSTCLEHHMD